MEFILTTPEQLSQLLRVEISKALNNSQPKQQMLPDRCNLEEALEITGLSKSKIYKLTSAGAIPVKTFGTRRLVFSRKELLAWVESKTTDKKDTSGIELALAKSARNKKGGANHA
ncbi:MAG: helix-turn-helix transcriptional regulator [Rufibacter sp.]